MSRGGWGPNGWFGTFDPAIKDDLVGIEPPGFDMTAVVERFGRVMPPFTKGGAYRNRMGELVTWDATEDGSVVTISTWPGE